MSTAIHRFMWLALLHWPHLLFTFPLTPPYCCFQAHCSPSVPQDVSRISAARHLLFPLSRNPSLRYCHNSLLASFIWQQSPWGLEEGSTPQSFRADLLSSCGFCCILFLKSSGVSRALYWVFNYQHARKEGEYGGFRSQPWSARYHFYPYLVWSQLSQEHFLNTGAWEIYSYCL